MTIPLPVSPMANHGSPPAESFRKTFTTSDYYKLTELGFFDNARRTELIQGEIYEMTPMGARHRGFLFRLNRLLSRASMDGKFCFASQATIALDDTTAVDPDFVLAKPSPDDYTKSEMRPEHVLLIIEISESSLRLDRDRKAPLYARAGILEYWIVDLNSDTVIAHREPRPEGYRVIEYFKDEPEVVSQTLPALKIPLKDLFASGGSAEKA